MDDIGIDVHKNSKSDLHFDGRGRVHPETDSDGAEAIAEILARRGRSRIPIEASAPQPVFGVRQELSAKRMTIQIARRVINI